LELLPGTFDDGYEDRGQFIGFFAQGRKPLRGNDSSVGKQFEPVSRFLDLTEAITALGDELGLASSTIRLAIVCSDGSSRTEDLFS